MSTKEYFAELGAVAEDLGYGIAETTPFRVVLVGQQSGVRITVETPILSGEILRRLLLAVPHLSGRPYTRDFEANAR